MRQFQRMKFFHLDFHGKFSLRGNWPLLAVTFVLMKNDAYILVSSLITETVMQIIMLKGTKSCKWRWEKRLHCSTSMYIDVLSLDLSQPSFMKEVDFYRFSFRHLSDVYFIDPVFKRLGLIKLYYFEWWQYFDPW